MTNWPRYERATLLRREGKAFKEIGSELGVSNSRAAQMRDYFVCCVATGHVPNFKLTDDELTVVQRFRTLGYLAEPATAADLYVWYGTKELPTGLVNTFRRHLFDVGRVKSWDETSAFIATLRADEVLRIPGLGRGSLANVETWLASRGMKLQQPPPIEPKMFAWEVTFVVDPKARRVSKTFNAKSAHAALKRAVLILELLPGDQLVSAEITGPTQIPKASPKPKGVVPHAATANQKPRAA